MSGASERANGGASGPVLQSVFLAVIDHSEVIEVLKQRRRKRSEKGFLLWFLVGKFNLARKIQLHCSIEFVHCLEEVHRRKNLATAKREKKDP